MDDKEKRIEELEKAIEDYTKTIETEPDNVEAYYNRGDAYRKLGEKEKAVADFTKAVKLKPELVEGEWFAKFEGKIYQDPKEYREALKLSSNRYNAYEIWTSEEDQELLALSSQMNRRQLADHFKRMPGGIKSRLTKLS